MYGVRHVVTLVSDGSGDGTAYTPVVTGQLVTIRYVKTDYTNGVDFTITAEATGETLWTQVDVNASVTVAPRQPVASTAGVAALYAAGGTAIFDPILLVQDRVKIVIANAGATKTGAFHVVVA
jgi:hypothetical protein